jgi:hypothetical protein
MIHIYFPESFFKILFALIRDNNYEAKLFIIQLKKIVLKEDQYWAEGWDYIDEILNECF